MHHFYHVRRVFASSRIRLPGPNRGERGKRKELTRKVVVGMLINNPFTSRALTHGLDEYNVRKYLVAL